MRLEDNVHVRPRHEAGWNTMYRVTASSAQAERVMLAVLPYMGERRSAKIREILAMDLSHRPKATA